MQPRVVLDRRLLRVGDSPAGRHQVELTRSDHLLAAEAVPVQHVAGQQPGHRLQPDMRVRRHHHSGDAVDRHRPVMVDEAPGAHAPPQAERQQSPYGDIAYGRDSGLGKFKPILLKVSLARIKVLIDCAHRALPPVRDA